MTLAIFPNAENGPAKKAGRRDQRLHPNVVQQFTVRKWWHTPISSLKCVTFGLFYLIGVSGTLASFPWEDSTVVQRLTIVLFVSPHIFFTLWIFVAAVATWTDPFKLKFYDNGDLVLHSVLRRRHAAIKDLKTVSLTKQDIYERGDDMLGIRVKFSGSMLRLCRFAEREEFLKALKVANPAVVVEFE